MGSKLIQNNHLIHEYLTNFKKVQELYVKKNKMAITLEKNDVINEQKKVAWIFLIPALFYAFSLFFVTGDPIAAFTFSYKGESVDHISMISVLFSVFINIGYVFFISDHLNDKIKGRYSINSFSYFKGVAFNWFSHISLFIIASCSLNNDIEFSNIVTPLFWYLIFGHCFVLFLIYSYLNTNPDSKVTDLNYEEFDNITIEIKNIKQYELLLQYKILENELLMTQLVGKSKYLSFQYEENYDAYKQILDALKYKSENIKKNDKYVESLKESLNVIHSSNKNNKKSLIENN